MPIYEYRCGACGHQLESLQRLADAPLVTCPACGKNTLTKSVTAAGFQLKGSGWYATDFRNSGAKPAPTATDKDASKADNSAGAAAGASDAAAGTGKTEPKTETKTETKTEAKAADKPSPSAGTTSTTGS